MSPPHWAALPSASPRLVVEEAGGGITRVTQPPWWLVPWQPPPAVPPALRQQTCLPCPQVAASAESCRAAGCLWARAGWDSGLPPALPKPLGPSTPGLTPRFWRHWAGQRASCPQGTPAADTEAGRRGTFGCRADRKALPAPRKWSLLGGTDPSTAPAPHREAPTPDPPGVSHLREGRLGPSCAWGRQAAPQPGRRFACVWPARRSV